MTSTSFRLDGKVAIVTGASQGIGLAISVALADAGAAVAVTNLPSKQADIDTLCRQITSAGGTAKGYALDITDTLSIKPTFARIAQEMGGFDILVNNAGVRVNRPSLEISEEDWDVVLNVNLRGTFFCAQAAAAHMVAQSYGRIINVASQLAVSSSPGRAAYVASKGGIVSLTQTLALEWIRDGVTVNAIGPGPTETPLTANSTPANEATLMARSPLGRRQTPEEIAGSVVFLASDAANTITGHHLLIDGGWTAG
jgi:2-deoxy-D-gluconate 3-dehydrogenase